jgi:hypothetical protein
MKALLMAAGAALFGSVALLPVATGAQNRTAGIPGFLDPSTGVFTARPALLPAAALQRSGTITLTITATIGSNIPSSIPVTCGVTLSSFDSSFSNSVFGSSPLTRSGNGGTCKIAVPYIFQVASAATALSVRASLGASTLTPPVLSYSASFTFAPFPVPSGNKNLAVTLAM